MENFIGNHVKFLAEWGQIVSGFVLLLCVGLIYLFVRHNRYFSPKGFFGYTTVFLLLLLGAFNVLVFMRITKVKPGVMGIIHQLENVKGKSLDLQFRLVGDSSEVNIKDYSGKVVLLNFWATWCKPCLTELPDLNQLHQDFREKDLVVIALSDESYDRLVRFIDKKPLQLIAGFTPAFTWATMGSERPVTFLIDKEGRVVDYYTGAYDYEYFKSKVNALLSSN